MTKHSLLAGITVETTYQPTRMQVCNYQAMLQQLNPETTIITPNRRLAATLQQLYQNIQITTEKTYWQTADILPLPSWLTRLWQIFLRNAFSLQPLLLNSAQEQLLWEKIIAQSKAAQPLLQVSETADLAHTAYELLQQWQIDWHDPIFTNTEDYAALSHWLAEFQLICEKEKWLDQASLPHVLARIIHDDKIHLPKKIILCGFTEINPQLSHLLQLCQDKKVSIEQIELNIEFNATSTAAAARTERISLPDEAAEIFTMARWAKHQLAQQPQAKIGCIVPHLDTIRDRVKQIFSSVFAHADTYTIDPQQSLFNISAGKSLLEYPIIHDAFLLLTLTRKKIDYETIYGLFTTPYLGEAELERLARSQFDLTLRQKNIALLDLQSTVQTEDALSLATQCPHLARRLRRFYHLFTTLPSPTTFQAWAHYFNELLTTLGWPGERSVNSEEYQIIDAWLTLLQQYATLDQISAAPAEYQAALSQLKKLARKTIFQPKSPPAPIQVLGVLEAAGLPLDYVWMCGLDDTMWPPQPKPNPFIPKSLQRELNMPHASAERELYFCQLLLQQFQQSTTRFILSHAEKKDGLELQMSPLIMDLPAITIEQLALPEHHDIYQRIYQSQLIETLEDKQGPVVTEAEKIYGGINIIKYQALCPFRAFAQWRLHAQELDQALLGMRAKERGTLAHKILELFWQEIQDSSQLQAMTMQELEIKIEHCIQQALNTVPHFRHDYPRYINLEKRRLIHMMKDWIAIEKQRPPFKVLNHEKKVQLDLQPLKITMRIDRIDELSDGNKLIIDYKTGKYNDINAWFSERPEEPQLPLYAMLDPEKTIAIAFAQINPGHHGFKGVSAYDLEITGIKLPSDIKNAMNNWQAQLTHWQVTFAQLSTQFQQGDAKIDPKNQQQTCQWCALQALCRINESEQIS